MADQITKYEYASITKFILVVYMVEFITYFQC